MPKIPHGQRRAHRYGPHGGLHVGVKPLGDICLLAQLIEPTGLMADDPCFKGLDGLLALVLTPEQADWLRIKMLQATPEARDAIRSCGVPVEKGQGL